jgi:hypothetical protein
MTNRTLVAAALAALATAALVTLATPAEAITSYCTSGAVVASNGHRVNAAAVQMSGMARPFPSTLHFMRNGGDTLVDLHTSGGQTVTANMSSTVAATYFVRSYGDSGQTWHNAAGQVVAYCDSNTIAIS